jgi:trimeric autotransporter adhesin
MKSFFKLHLTSVLFASALVLTLTACNNPLGGDLKQSKFDDAHQPGLPNQNVAPVASNSNLTVLKNIVKSETLSGSDANSDDTLSFSVVAQGTKGVVAVTNAATGAFTYTPNNNIIGSDSFTFKVNDGKLDSNTATVTVTIYDPNIAPVASAISPAAFNEDIQSGVITLSYVDADADLATACTISNLSNVTVTQACACDGAGVCTLRVTGTANYFGAASFDYTVTATGQDSNTAAATLSIAAVNDAPTMTAISAQSTNEDAAKAVTFSIADVETAITCGASVSMSSTNTTLVPNTNVVWSGTAPTCTGTVTPAANQYGTSDLTFTVTDGTLTAARTFTLTVSQLGDDSFNGTVLGDYWPFDALSTALYSFSSSVIQFSGGIAELIGTLQTDSEATENTDNTFTVGTTMNGVVYDTLTVGPTKGLKLGNNVGCNGATTNCSELDSSWTPQWGSLINYWKMNNDWNDAIGSGNGTSNNGIAFTTSSKIGSHAGNFDGSDDFVSLTSDPMAGRTQLSVSAWIKFSDVASYNGIAGAWAGDANMSALLFTGTNNKAYFRIDTTTSTAATIMSNTSVQDNLWHHVVGTYDGSFLRIYVDGVEEGTAVAQSGTVASSAGALFNFGRYNNSNASTPTGLIDEVAIWSKGLTRAEVKNIYDRQSASYSGTFTSRIMDAKSSSSWTTLSWIPTLPFFKELPDYSGGAVQNETSNSTTGYSSLVGSSGSTGANDLMTGIVGLWHLDESTWADVASEVKDDSGQANHGRAKNGAVPTSSGKLLNGGIFDGVNDRVEIPYSATINPNTFSVSFWANVTGGAGSYRSTVSSRLSDNNGTYIFYAGSSNTWEFWSGNGTGWQRIQGVSGPPVVLNQWIHIVGTYDGTTMKLYSDGALYASLVFVGTLAKNTSGVTYIGSGGNAGASLFYFPGIIDEVAIWSRALHTNEIKQLYQRGASRLKYQVRSCDDSACSGETWQGPDGTSGTYFSELNNNTTPLTGAGDVKATLPSMLFSNFTSAPSTNQYFQYRTILESDSSTAALMPELKSTTVDPIHYPTYLSTDTSPLNTIIGQNGVAFYDLNNFAQSLGAGSCSNGVVYNLGLSNTGPWKYWTGAAWATADGSSAQANTAAALVASSNAALTAFATDVARGSVFFKAFMTSTGTSKCELDNILVGGNK